MVFQSAPKEGQTMSQLGVNPAPTGNSGSSGDQPAAGAPAPQEAKSAENVFGGSPASGKDDRVPYARFKEVFENWKGAEERLARLESGSRPPQKSADEMLQELRSLARKSADDPDKLVDVFEQMAAIKATTATSEALKNIFEENDKRSRLERAKAIQRDSTTRALREFPELGDPNSDFFKLAAETYASMESLHEVPDGEYIAAQIASGKRSKGVGRPAPLNASGVQRQQSPEGGDDFADDRASAMQAMRDGKMAAVDAFFTKHQSRFLQKPTY